MAIIGKKDKKDQQDLPEVFLEHTRKAFSYQQIRDQYDDVFKSEKTWVTDYLTENSDGLSVEVGKSLKTPEGMICYTERENWKIDTAAIEKMIKSGELSLATVLNISNINAKKLMDCIGQSKFEQIASNSSTGYLTFKANNDFKQHMAEMFSVEGPAVEKPVEAPKQAAKPVEKAKTAKDLKDSIKAAKEAEKLIKAKSKPSKTADEDLEAILNG